MGVGHGAPQSPAERHEGPGADDSVEEHRGDHCGTCTACEHEPGAHGRFDRAAAARKNRDRGDELAKRVGNHHSTDWDRLAHCCEGSAFSWPWIFFVNVPVGVAVIAVSPLLLRESRADLPDRYFDFAGAATITAGLMLLVYGMTRATQHGWGTPATIGLLTASAVLIASFFLIESRTKAPLLPLRILRLRTLAGSNLSALIATAAVFSQFFLLTLYMQQVLHYSALKTGVAYIGLTVTTIALSAVAQGLVTRFGVRGVLPVGLALSTVALVFFAQLPVDGHYFWDLFPGFIISGLGLAFVFIPMSIGALTGVRPADAGIASGLINTSQQIGGAVGVAAATTIATTFTNHYVHSHAGTSAFSAPALTHGFQIAFYALAATAAVGAVIAAVLIEPQRAQAEPEPEAAESQVAAASQHTPVCRTGRAVAGDLAAHCPQPHASHK